MPPSPSEPVTPAPHGISLAEYAAVQAGLGEGLELDAVLELEGIDPAVWPDAEDAWSDLLLEDLEADGPLESEYDARLAEGQERYGRRVPPLDEDLAKWLDFVRIWAADAEPIAFLERLGLRPADVLRLQRMWSGRLAAEPALQQEAREILERDPGDLATPRPEPRTLERAARPKVAVAPVTKRAADDDEDDEELDDDEAAPAEGEAEPGVFADLAEWLSDVAPPQQANAAPGDEPHTLLPARSPLRRAPVLPFTPAPPGAPPPAARESSPVPMQAIAPPDDGIDTGTLPPMPSPLRREAVLPYSGAVPSYLAQPNVVVAPRSDLQSTGQLPEGLLKAALPFMKQSPAAEAPVAPAAPSEPGTAPPAPSVVPRAVAMPRSDLQATGTLPEGLLKAALPFMKQSHAPEPSEPGTAPPAPFVVPRVAMPRSDLQATGTLPEGLLKAALPFMKQSPAPEATAAPSELPAEVRVASAPAPLVATGVIDASALMAAALPFMKKGSAPAAPQAPSPVAEAPPALPAAPSTEAGAAPPSRGTAALTLAQYASLCAELAVFPTATEQTFHRYGLAVVSRRLSVDLAWQERLRRNPAEYAEWQRLHQHYQAYFRSAGR